MPPVLRALSAVPGGRAALAQIAISSLIEAGRLPRIVNGVLGPLDGDPFAFWSGPPVALLHIEKTAGTALAMVLSRQCHPMQIYTDPDLGETQRLGAPAQPPPDLADRKLIWGHYDLPGLRRLAPGRLIITMLREPQARVLSLYYFWRSIHPDRVAALADPRVTAAHDLGLLDFLRCQNPAVRDSIGNAYVRRLASLNAGGTLPDIVALDPEGALTQAMLALDDVACAGIVERMADSLMVMSHLLGLEITNALPQVNVGTRNAADAPDEFRDVARQTITPEIATELQRLTRLDLAVYDACSVRLTAAANRLQSELAFRHHCAGMDHGAG